MSLYYLNFANLLIELSKFNFNEQLRQKCSYLKVKNIENDSKNFLIKFDIDKSFIDVLCILLVG